MTDSKTYVDTERNILLTIYDDGDVTIRWRDEHRAFLPPVRLLPERTEIEPLTKAELITQMDDLREAEAAAKWAARIEAGLPRWSK